MFHAQERARGCSGSASSWRIAGRDPGRRLALADLPAVLLSRHGRSSRASSGRARPSKFVAQSLQLRNDICNEPTWEAVFTDQEVNAWLAEDLVTHFADQLPPEVHEPRVALRARSDHPGLPARPGGVQSVITVVARPRVPEGNTVELTLEKIRAGILPVPADNVLDRIIEYARYHGLDVEWTRRDGYPVVADPLHAQPRARRRPARGGADPDRPDPPGGPVRPDAGGVPSGRRSPRARCFSPSSPGGRSRTPAAVGSGPGPGGARPRRRAESPASRTRTRPGLPDPTRVRSPRRSAARVPRSPETAPS